LKSARWGIVEVCPLESVELLKVTWISEKAPRKYVKLQSLRRKTRTFVRTKASEVGLSMKNSRYII
jgi:hypothetical protein